MTSLKNAVIRCCSEFRKAKRELSDLRPRFWATIGDLEYAADFGNESELEEALKVAYPQLGAPGDFGYETKHGDALKRLYDAWTATIQGRKCVS